MTTEKAAYLMRELMELNDVQRRDGPGGASSSSLVSPYTAAEARGNDLTTELLAIQQNCLLFIRYISCIGEEFRTCRTHSEETSVPIHPRTYWHYNDLLTSPNIVVVLNFCSMLALGHNPEKIVSMCIDSLPFVS